jgi:hypothetical protein
MALMMDSSTACTVVAKIASIVVRRHFGQWLFPVFGVWVRGGERDEDDAGTIARSWRHGQAKRDAAARCKSDFD